MTAPIIAPKTNLEQIQLCCRLVALQRTSGSCEFNGDLVGAEVSGVPNVVVASVLYESLRVCQFTVYVDLGDRTIR